MYGGDGHGDDIYGGEILKRSGPDVGCRAIEDEE
jgi:hypothetical protein